MNVGGKERCRRGTWDALSAFFRRITFGLGPVVAQDDATDLECVELKVQLAHGEDPDRRSEELLRRLQHLNYIVSVPAPEVKTYQFNLSGTVLSLRVFCSRRHYWRVFMSLGELCSQVGSPIVRPRTRRKLEPS